MFEFLFAWFFFGSAEGDNIVWGTKVNRTEQSTAAILE